MCYLLCKNATKFMMQHDFVNTHKSNCKNNMDIVALPFNKFWMVIVWLILLNLIVQIFVISLFRKEVLWVHHLHIYCVASNKKIFHLCWQFLPANFTATLILKLNKLYSAPNSWHIYDYDNTEAAIASFHASCMQYRYTQT